MWKRLYFSPARRQLFGVRRLAGAAEGARRAEPGVVDQDDQHVGRALGRAQLLDRREFGVRILRVIGDQPGSLGRGDREMRTMFLVFAAHGLMSPSCWIGHSNARLTDDAAETDMAGRGVHRLRMTRRRAVAAAVIWRAQMRAALQHLTRDPDFGLARVVARILTTAPRIDRNAAGLLSSRPRVGVSTSRWSIPTHCRSCRRRHSRSAGMRPPARCARIRQA